MDTRQHTQADPTYQYRTGWKFEKKTMSSARNLALGIPLFCRVPNRGHSAKPFGFYPIRPHTYSHRLTHSLAQTRTPDRPPRRRSATHHPAPPDRPRPPGHHPPQPGRHPPPPDGRPPLLGPRLPVPPPAAPAIPARRHDSRPPARRPSWFLCVHPFYNWLESSPSIRACL